MSVLNALKEKINDVQYDFKKSLQSFRKPQKELKRHSKTEGIDLNAGADLLHRSQKQWAELSSAAQINASAADETAVQIGSLYQDIQKNWGQLSVLTSMVSSLPQLLESVNTVNTQIEDLEKHIRLVEDEMIVLEDLCDRCEVNKNKLDHQYQLSLYKQRKNVQLEEDKIRLARKHAKNVEGYEQKLKELMKERQKAFDEVFQEEMQYYKQYGRTQRTTSQSSSSTVDISEIALEEDTSELDEFLKSDDFTASASQPDAPAAEGDMANVENDADDEADDDADDEAETDDGENTLNVTVTPDDDNVS